ncbi:hypothetical protein BDV26DRAFT_302971 [Aspergillus bertholletiae]|uniref:Short-chain dehydrogenase n=1 Tax=Aspergillus bertholletiae TaxID=1226010 RepID=A0A5N7BP59_9EURO|nr:hypothetical protein BDV26DRAFT_302971 [Aspergillus bertholletiae]
MVPMSEVRASNKQLTAATVPQVAIFVGATAGIGKAALTELVSAGFPLKAYIIGRDEAAFQPTITELHALNPSANFTFLQGKVSLMAETTHLIDIILRREEHIDLLFLSAGFLPFLGRQETSEGIELSTAVAYYSRLVFIRRLLPLLQAAAKPGNGHFPPRIISVLGTGVETTNLFLDDLTLKQPGHFSVPSYTGHVATMTSASLKRLAEQPENKNIVIMHHHPGLVSTDIFKKSWGARWNESKENKGPAAPANIARSTPEEAGERSLFLMTSAKYGGNGVPVSEGQKGGWTVQGTSSGSLLCVGDQLETLNLGDLLNSLEQSGAADTIWNHTERLIGAYL